MNNVIVSGMGIVTHLGEGVEAHSQRIYGDHQSFTRLKRDGRQSGESAFYGAEIADSELAKYSGNRRLNLSEKVALSCAEQALDRCELDEIGRDRIGVICGGNNTSNRQIFLTQKKYAEKAMLTPPRYIVETLDTNILGVISEEYCLGGCGFNVGASSCSGQMALIQASELIKNGVIDACLVVGLLQDISYVELSSFMNLGALDSRTEGAYQYTPYSTDRNGFVYGEAGAAVFLKSDKYRNTGNNIAQVSGWASALSSTAGPQPDRKTILRVIKDCINQCGLTPNDLDYINPHASGSNLGDEVEVAAILEADLSHVPINTTKSIVGHSLSAAGLVEMVISLIQLRNNRLHGSLGIAKKIDDRINLVTEATDILSDLSHVLNLSYAFSGIKTAVILNKID